MILRFILFLILNFGALAIGGYFTGDGVRSEWYANAIKAPWTPPGWVFGAAWTIIMLCFSFYKSILWDKISNKNNFITLYLFQWILNVAWNPTFFYFKKEWLALAIIVLLFTSISIYLILFRKNKIVISCLILPYWIWLVIAISLNFYFCLYN